MTDKSISDETNKLLRSFLVIYNNHPLRMELWQNRAGEPLKEVFERLMYFHLNQLMVADQSEYETYSQDLIQNIRDGIGELICIGFYIYYADKTAVMGKSITRNDDPGLKSYLMKVVERLEDGQQADEFEPPRYAFEACKESFWYWLKAVTERPDNQNFFKQITSETHRQFLLAKSPWLVCEGYMSSNAQDHYKGAS